jgi:AraC-like DNA-binding protein
LIFTANLAYAAGSCDQPHFNRDFKSLTGKTPGDHLADRRLNPWMILRDHLGRDHLGEGSPPPAICHL